MLFSGQFDHVHAACANVVQTLGFTAARQFDFPLAGIDGRLTEQLAVSFRQLLPDALVHREDQWIGHVVPERQVLLADLVDPRDVKYRQRILLAIDGAGGESRLGIGPAHLCGVGAQRGEGVLEQRRADHPYLQARQIRRGSYRFDGVGEFAEAVLAPGQRDDAALFDRIECLLACLALGDGVEVGTVGHQERQREQVQLRHLRRPVDGRADRHVDQARAHGREFFRLIAGDQLGIGVNPQGDFPLGALLDQIGPFLRGLAPGEGVGEHGGDGIFASSGREARGQCGSDGQHGEATGQFHGASLFGSVFWFLSANGRALANSGGLGNGGLAIGTRG